MLTAGLVGCYGFTWTVPLRHQEEKSMVSLHSEFCLDSGTGLESGLHQIHQSK